jgi:site-specific recombinase XerD
MAFFTIVSEALASYEQWLTSQPLSAHTRRTYLTQVTQYCTYLSTFPWGYGHPLQEPHARDYAVRDYKTALKAVHLAKPSSVNLALAAVDHFYRFLELPTPQVTREDLPTQAPRALEPAEQKRFLRAVERCSSVRDRAIALLLFYTGLRISECAALTLNDVRLSSRKGLVIVRMGKGNTYREVPLNAEVRTALDTWLEQRKKLVSQRNESALFLTKQGRRLATRTIDDVVRQLGQEANLSLSAHILRHTCLTSLVRNGNDLVLVAELAGHKRLETTRRYSLPSAADREAAMEGLKVDYSCLDAF